MNENPTPTKPRSMPDVVQSSSERISVTDSGGTVARFEMSYPAPSIDQNVRFKAPLRQRLPSMVFLALTLAFGAAVIFAYQAPSANALFAWIVEGDRVRALPANAFAIVLNLCALGVLARAHMRGVTVGQDWILVRAMLPLGIPQAKRWGWAQVNRIIVDRQTVAIELMDGSFNALPPVHDAAKLRDVLVMHALKKKVQITLLETGSG